MNGPTAQLVIDARPRGPAGPLAAEPILDRPVLAHLIDLAEQLGQPAVTIHARLDEFGELRRSIPDSASIAFHFAPGPPPEGRTILRADRLYDRARLRRILRRGGDPEGATLWRLDRPEALASAGEELIRRSTYQPLGRYWALGPARRLARWLRPTRVRPNHVTLLASATFLAGAAAVASGGVGPGSRIVAAAALALALVLDTADGHLARLQGTATPFGRWLDATLDELGDVALHAAVAWSMAARTSHMGWLLAGLAYVSGKYIFIFGSMSWESAAGDGPEGDPGPLAEAGWGRRLARLAGHADWRWHLWILLALLGRLEMELILYSAYYPARALAGAWTRSKCHG